MSGGRQFVRRKIRAHHGGGSGRRGRSQKIVAVGARAGQRKKKAVGCRVPTIHPDGRHPPRRRARMPLALTGGGSTVQGRALVIQPLDGRPFFSRTGQAVQVAFLLKERRSGLSRPVQFAVCPLNEGES